MTKQLYEVLANGDLRPVGGVGAKPVNNKNKKGGGGKQQEGKQNQLTIKAWDCPNPSCTAKGAQKNFPGKQKCHYCGMPYEHARAVILSHADVAREAARKAWQEAAAPDQPSR